jgi:mRNA-degrading endonuclease RelE of RelBE toxin-antitoxin system
VSYVLRVPARVADLIRGLHPEITKKNRASLQAIVQAPNVGKSLKDELSGLRSYRMGRLRIVYRVTDDRVIEIASIGPRTHVYQETFRLVQREHR